MKQVKRVIGLTVSLILLATSVVFADMEENGIYEASSFLKMKPEIQKVIDEYFQARENVLNANITTEKNYMTILNDAVDSRNTKLMSLETKHLDARENMAKYHGVNIVSSSCTPCVKEIKPMQIVGFSNSYKITIDEWTWIEYNDGKNGPIDEMGYMTTHEMTIGENRECDTVIVDNTYDDSMFTGELQQTVSPTVEEKISTEDDVNISETLAISTSNVSVNKIIEYADKWVRHRPTDSGIYNPAYPEGFYPLGVDCANYVSQCLREGGLSNDFGSDNVRNNKADDWWFYENGSSDLTKTSPSWRLAPDMKKYFTEKGISVVTATSSNVFPGNPVFCPATDNSGVVGDFNHVGICVGYNHQGIPILNAHTNDRYHVPYTFFNYSSAHPARVVKLFNSNKMGTTPSAAGEITMSTSPRDAQVNLRGGESKFWHIKHPSNQSDRYDAKFVANLSSTTVPVKIYVYQQLRNHGNNYSSYMYELGNGTGNAGHPAILTVKINPQYNYYVRVYADTISNTSIPMTLGYQIE